MKKYAIIILAAGASSRLGRTKQLLPFRDTTLLKNIVDSATHVKDALTLVVTGAEKEQIEAALKNDDVNWCYNELWQEGMGSSIRAGINEIISKHPGTHTCIIAVCDQPYVTTEVFNKLIEKQIESGKGIVASSYADTLGTPALFTDKYFYELQQLNGEEGAKKLLKKYSDDMSPVPFKKGKIDIDTTEDYQRLIGESES